MPAPNLTRAKRSVETLMLDSCRIEREGSETATFDETTGQYTAGPLTAVYTGKCLFAADEGMLQEVAGQTRETYSPRCLLPLGAAVVHEGDYLTVTGSRYDPTQVGREYVVRSVNAGTFQVAIVLSVEDRREIPGGVTKR